MREYMVVWHSPPLTPVQGYTCYMTRWLDWVRRGLRSAWHWVRHRRATADYLSKLLRKRRLWAWLKRRRPEED